MFKKPVYYLIILNISLYNIFRSKRTPVFTSINAVIFNLDIVMRLFITLFI